MKHSSHHHHTTFNLLVTILLGGALLITLLVEDAAFFPISPKDRAGVGANAAEEGTLVAASSDADAEARQKYFEESVKKAQATDRLVIGDCKGNPEVIKLQDMALFTIANTDDEPHSLSINENISYEIPAKGMIEVKADFGKGPGLYGYGCDREPSAAGLILIESAPRQ